MELTPDKWQRAKAVFDAALQRPRSEREAFLASVCAEAELRQQVEQLLRDHEEAGSFLSKPIFAHENRDVDQSGRFASGSLINGRFATHDGEKIDLVVRANAGNLVALGGRSQRRSF